MNYIIEYKNAVFSGEIVAGEYIKKVLAYLCNGLEKNEFFYDEKRASLAIDFIQRFCHHSEGRSDCLMLELWQKAVISSIFGIVDENGIRQFREVILVIARKNGKSLLASAIVEYVHFLDGEYGAKIFCLAPKLEQAAKVYDGYIQMISKEPTLERYIKKRRSDLYIEKTNSSVKPLAFNAKKSDGFNPHLVVCDEIASWPAEQGKKQYEVMRSALGSRVQPLIIGITTAGYINDGPYDDLIARSTSFLNGNSSEKRLLPFLYIIDNIDKWNDIEELKKSNPNLGVSVSEDYYKEEIAIAENNLSKHSEFMTKYCNIKQSSTVAWIPYDIVDNCCGEEYSLDDFKSSYCVGGIDLSQTTDLTSCCVIIEKNEKLYTFSKFFMPSNKIDELQEREGVPYRIYQRMGLLQASGENFVDYNDCFNWFRELVENYEIFPLQVGYDRYSAQYLVQQMSSCGFHMDDVFQGENLTSVIREADGLLRDRKLLLGTNNLLKAHFLNVAMKQNDETRKIRPVKIEQRCHIDGFVAVIDALTVRQKWFDEIGEQLKNN